MSDSNNEIIIDIAATLFECLPRHSHILMCAALNDLRLSAENIAFGLQSSPYSLIFALPAHEDCISFSNYIGRRLQTCGDPMPPKPIIATYAGIGTQDFCRASAGAAETLCLVWLTPNTFEDCSALILFRSLRAAQFNKIVFMWGFGNARELEEISGGMLRNMFGSLHAVEFGAKPPAIARIDYAGFPPQTDATHAPFPGDAFWQKKMMRCFRVNNFGLLRALTHAAHVHHQTARIADGVADEYPGNIKADVFLSAQSIGGMCPIPPSKHVVEIDAVRAVPHVYDISAPRTPAAAKRTPERAAEADCICQSEFALLSLTANCNAASRHGKDALSEYNIFLFIIWEMFKTIYSARLISFADLLARFCDIAEGPEDSDELSGLRRKLSEHSEGLSEDSAELSENPKSLSSICGELPDSAESRSVRRNAELLKTVLRDWRAKKYIDIARTYDASIAAISARPEMKKCFPGVSRLSDLDPMLQFRHSVLVQTPNREPIGRIASSFFDLPASQLFFVQQTACKKQFRASAHLLTAQATQTLIFPLWLDSEPEILSYEEAQNIEKLLRRFPATQAGDITPRSGDASPAWEISDAAFMRIRAIASRFEPFFRQIGTERMLLQIGDSSADLWAFSGARLHAAAAIALEAAIPGIEIGYGNLSLHMRWNDAFATNAKQAGSQITETVKNVFSLPFCRLPDDLRNALRAGFQKLHPLNPISPVIPEPIGDLIAEQCYKAMQTQVFGRNISLAFASGARRDESSKSGSDCGSAPDPMRGLQSFAYIDTAWHEREIARKSPKPAIRSRASAHRRVADGGGFDHVKIQSAHCPYAGDGSFLHTELPWYYIDNASDFNRAINVILKQPHIGLDVETTLADQSLRLVQIGCSGITFVIDPLSVDIRPLAQVMANPNILKLIHNASFEKRVLGQHYIQIAPIADTMTLSKRTFGSKAAGGHSLATLCARVFGLPLCKTCQTSDWSQRPLSARQLEYAALDAEILVRLYPHLMH